MGFNGGESLLGLGKGHPQNQDELEDVVKGCFMVSKIRRLG